jgi:ubiquinone/menaquinone biosynthesis C-methylase UbiE
MNEALAAKRLAFQQHRAAELEQRLLKLLAPLARDTRLLDAGCGTGALACALAPHVLEVVGIDADPASVAAATASAPANCSFQVGDATALSFAGDSFSLAGCLRVLHHVARPDSVVEELARCTRPRGVVLVVDQLGSSDPQESLAIETFERARDPSHQRLLTDTDIRGLLAAHGLDVRSSEATRELRQLDPFLDLVGLKGRERARVRSLAPGEEYEVEIGWYVAVKL